MSEHNEPTDPTTTPDDAPTPRPRRRTRLETADPRLRIPTSSVGRDEDLTPTERLRRKHAQLRGEPRIPTASDARRRS